MPSGLSSMTGYGRNTARIGGWLLQIDCRSVNHDRLSVRIDTPDELGWLRSRFRTRIDEKLDRGRVEVGVELQPAGEGEQVQFDRIDDARFGAVAYELERLAIDHGLASPVSMEAVLEFREFFERGEGEVLDENDSDAIEEVFGNALAALVDSRRREGESIARQLQDHLETLTESVAMVEQLRQRGKNAAKTRVEQRLREALEKFELDEIDEGRLTQEVAYYVEKGDIAEEIQRTRSHVEQLEQIIDESGEAVGKKIDFYLQELIRETNTMGSKSRHSELTDRVIEMKSLVEKMREQAANVE